MAETSHQTYDERFGAAFQAHILACCARTPGFVLRYRSAIAAKYFADKVHAIIADALLAHIDAYKVLPTRVTLTELCREKAGSDKMPLVEKMLEKMYADDISDCAAVQAIVVEFGKTQAMVQAAVDIIDYVNTQKLQKVLPRVREAQLVGEDLLSIGVDYAATVDERADFYLNPEVHANKIPTGIHHLDMAMGGGLGRGELGVVLAPPGKGKSSVLFNIGFGALLSLDKLKVVHYSLEMLRPQVLERYDDRLMGHLVKNKRPDPYRYVEDLKSRVHKFIQGQLMVQHYSTRSCTPSMIRSNLTLLQAQGFKPDLIIVDYADIMKPERRIGEMRHEQAGIYEDLRSIAGDYDAGLWTASQATKNTLNSESGGTKDIITIADFAEAFEKSAVVDAALAFVQTLSEISDKKCRLLLAKYRNKEDGSTIECKIQRDRCRITSTGLYDASKVRIGDDALKAPDEKLVERVHSAASTVAAVKAAAGVGPVIKNRPKLKSSKPTKMVGSI